VIGRLGDWEIGRLGDGGLGDSSYAVSLESKAAVNAFPSSNAELLFLQNAMISKEKKTAGIYFFVMAIFFRLERTEF